MADESFDSVLSGVKDAAQAQRALPAANAADSTSAPIASDTQGVLGQVKQVLHPDPVGPAQKVTEDDVRKYMQQEKPPEQPSSAVGGFVKSLLIPGNPFASSADKLKDANAFFTDSSAGRIADAMGHAVIEDVAAGTQSLLHPVSSHGVTKNEEDQFPINGEDKWQNTMNQVVRAGIATSGIAYTLQDAFMSLTSVPFSAAAAGATKGAEESGSEEFQHVVSTLTQPEVFGELYNTHGQHPLLNPAAMREFVTKPPLPVEVARAVDNGILNPEDQSIKAEAAQTASLAARTARMQAQKGLVNSDVTPGLHDIVRKDNPELFDNYDKLTAQLETTRSVIHDPEVAGKEYDEKIADLKKQREESLKLPTDLQSDELAAAVKKSQEDGAAIDAAIRELGNRNKYIVERKAQAQEDFVKLEGQLRDITPDVNKANAEAALKAKKAAFAPAEPKPFTEAPTESTAAPEAPAEAKPAFDIAADVKKKLSSEGRTKEQAEAESKVIAARYETAAANGWAKGTAEEIYKRHMAEIKEAKGGKGRGDILLASKNSGKAIIRLFKKNDSSTLMHEMAHHWLDEMVGWEKEADAPDDLKAHMDAVREWLGTDKGDLSGFTRRQHERWARGFERYLREGVVPSKELANAFAHFKDWLTRIYKSAKKLRVKLSPEVKNVFDHMLATKPEKIAIAEEAKPNENTGDKTVEGAERAAGGDTTGGENGSDAGGKEVPVQPAPVAADGGSGEGARDSQTKGDTGGSTEGNNAEGNAGATGGEPDLNGEKPAPKSKPAGELVDKAGNIVLKNLTTDQEVIAGLKMMAAKTQLLDHAVVGDVQVGEVARELGKDPAGVMKKLSNLAAENGIPLAAYVRAVRDMLANASAEVREFSAKVKGGTDADFQNAMEAKDRFMMIAATVSETANEIGRAMRAFQDISGSRKSANELNELLQQAGGSREKMEQLFQIIADKDAKYLRQQVPKILQKASKPGFWDKFAEWRRCTILSNYITHGLWLAGTVANVGYKALVLDTLGGIHNELGMLAGREDTGSQITGGLKGLSYVITKALPNILSATGAALTTGKTVLRPLEGEWDTYMATGGIRKTLNVNMAELKKATDSAFDIDAHPEIKALQDRVADTRTKGDTDKADVLQKVLDQKIDTKKAEIAKTIAARMQSRLKTWGELMGEMQRFGVSAAAAVTSVGKNLVSADFYKDKPLLEARSAEGKAVPDIYVKGINVAPIGSILRGTSGRIYSTMHTFSRELAANIEVTQEARRIAVKAGKTGADIDAHVANLLADPSQELMDRVTHIANKQTLMSNDSELAKAITRARNAFDQVSIGGVKNMGSIILPVVGVPAEAVHQTVTESSLVGLTNAKQRGKIMGEEGALEQERAQVKMIAGTALMGLGAWLYYQGATTASPSVNYQQNQQLADAGRQGASMRMGDWMIPLSHIPVIGNILTMGADLSHIHEVYRGNDISDKLRPATMSAIIDFFLHENSLVELANFMDAVRGQTDPASYLKNFATSMLVPQFIKATDDLTDPNVRESKSFMSSVLSKLPSESENVAPKINPLTGEPLQREPFHAHTATPDPIASALADIHIFPAAPRPSINDVDLTPQQAAEYASFKGHILHSGMEMLIEGDGKAGFEQADVTGKRKMAQKIETHAAQCAKSAMYARYPQILKDANDKYEASCAAEIP